MTEDRRLFRFFVPYVDKNGELIPAEHRDDYINVIETESCKLNGGYTSFEAKGGYLTADSKIMREDITVIETYGENPVPHDRMNRCSAYLQQESLVVMSVGNYEFQVHESSD